MIRPVPTILSPIFRGDSRNFHLIITDGVTPANPFDLTDCTVSFCMKKEKSQITKDVEIDVTVHDIDPALGITDVHLLTAHTEGLIPGQYQYDFQLITATLQKKTFQFGTIQVLEDVND